MNTSANLVKSELRRFPRAQRELALLIQLTVERMCQLPGEDVQDLVDLRMAYSKASDDEERDEIMSLMEDIFHGEREDIGEARPLSKHVDHQANRKLALWVGSEVARLRQAKGWTQGQLGDAAGIPQPHVSKIENGVYYATEKTRTKLAQALGVDPSVLDPCRDG